VAEPINADISEHDHLGPYMYLKIGTWHGPQLTDDWIAGPLPALAQLARDVRARVAAAGEGQKLSFRDSFAPQSTYDLTLKIEPDTFDPARADSGCW
jgi:hypothetical protein